MTGALGDFWMRPRVCGTAPVGLGQRGGARRGGAAEAFVRTKAEGSSKVEMEWSELARERRSDRRRDAEYRMLCSVDGRRVAQIRRRALLMLIAAGTSVGTEQVPSREAKQRNKWVRCGKW
jgi:hypothetical protein